MNTHDRHSLEEDRKPVFDKPLVFNDAIDTSIIKNILLIDSLVSDSQIFFDSANSDTFPIIYSYDSNRTDFSQLLDTKFANFNLERIAFVFHDNIENGKTFLNQELLFLESDILEDVSAFSPNSQLLIDTIKKFNVKHVDFLACNSLNYLNWKSFYGKLTKETSVVVGASNDKTGNLNYGGDWVMENTNENVVNAYFNGNIQNYTSTLAVTVLSTSTVVTQALVDSYTWPVTVNGGTSGSPVVITFGENITLNSASKYFVTGSNYITYDGSDNVVTISNVNGYPGLIKNGTTGYHAITVKNINTASVNSKIGNNCGWICQQNFGKNIKNIPNYVPILIDNCSNSGNVDYFGCGGIVGESSFNNGHGIIQNCHNTGTIIGIFSGGICGSGPGGTNGTLTIINCYNIGTITGNYSGCIIASDAGYENGTVIIEKCYNMGAINCNYGGGITAYCFGYNTNNLCSITNCYNLGNIAGSYSGGICGAKVGYTNNASRTPQISIENCYSLGNIAANSGGILGGGYDDYDHNPTVDISNCYVSYNSIADADSQYAALSLQIRNSVNKTNVYSQFMTSWSDTAASAALVGAPTSISVNNPGSIWNSIASDTPYRLSAINYIPMIAAISPFYGKIDGGTSVSIAGIGFTGTTSITFDGINATDIIVVNDYTMTCTAPAHSIGPVNVIFTTDSGASEPFSSFTYATLAITSFSPPNGNTLGGTSVTITGKLFTGTTSVTFDGIPATIIVVNDTTITCTTPAHIAGLADIVVTTNYGASTTFSSFTYLVLAPILSEISPSSGNELGGDIVTITGIYFTGTTSVAFGSNDASFNVVNDNTITCTTPAHLAGPVNIIVTTGTGSVTRTNGFTYIFFLSSTTVITQALVDSYRWPVTVNGGTSESPVVITFDENITLNSASKYFVTGSNYITYDGSDNVVTISNVTDYPGLIQNGADGEDGYHAIVVKNINTASVNSTLESYRGWICQGYFGRNIKNILNYVPILIDNCSNSGNVGSSDSGGIVGESCFNNGHGIIQNCYNAGTIGYRGGGICGSYAGLEAGNVTITNCHNTGAIDSRGGGIIGNNAGYDNATITILNCYNTGTISGEECGGIIGNNAGYDNATITILNCYNTGAINGDYAGGIGGYSFGNYTNNLCSITNCYNLGNINGSYSGGICGTDVGYTDDPGYTPQILIQNCYSLGNIAATCGGILGGGYDDYDHNPTVDISNCYVSYNSIADADSQYAALSLQIRNSVNKTNVYSEFITSWSDTAASAALVGAPTSISVNNPGSIWNSIASNTPYKLSSFISSITSISPTNGSIDGGDLVTITGIGFTGTTSVTFGGTQVSFTIVNDTTITFTTLAGINIDIVVTTDSGVSNPVIFNYVTLAITNISPSTGNTRGGNVVTITGTLFTGTTSVKFGLNDASFNVVNDTTIECTTPAHFARPVNVVVTTDAGSVTRTNGFTYIAICFKEGSKILTYHGYIPIEKLRKGDFVKTVSSGFKKIEHIGHSKMYHNVNEMRSKDKLYRCSMSEYPELTEDLIITGCHSILIENFKDANQMENSKTVNGKICITENHYRLPACVDERTKIFEEEGIHTIWHFSLEHTNYYFNYGVYANGLLVETTSNRMMVELSGMTLLE